MATAASEEVAAPMLVNGADEENWVEVRSGSNLQTPSEAANSAPGNSWHQVAPVVATTGSAGNFAEQSNSNAANWTYIDASGFQSVAIYNGLLPLAPPAGVPTPPPPQTESHGNSDVRFHGSGVFRPRGFRGRGGAGGGRGHYQRGISNNVAR